MSALVYNGKIEIPKLPEPLHVEEPSGRLAGTALILVAGTIAIIGCILAFLGTIGSGGYFNTFSVRALTVIGLSSFGLLVVASFAFQHFIELREEQIREKRTSDQKILENVVCKTEEWTEKECAQIRDLWQRDPVLFTFVIDEKRQRNGLHYLLSRPQSSFLWKEISCPKEHSRALVVQEAIALKEKQLGGKTPLHFAAQNTQSLKDLHALFDNWKDFLERYDSLTSPVNEALDYFCKMEDRELTDEENAFLSAYGTKMERSEIERRLGKIEKPTLREALLASPIGWE